MSTTTGIKVSKVTLKNGNVITLGTNQRNQPTIRIVKTITAGKYKGQERTIGAYYFGSEDSRTRYINELVENAAKRVNEKNEMKAKKAKALEEMNHGFEVGQILYASWGYEQTNIDFFQIVEIGKKSVKIRPIAGKVVEYSHNGSYGKKAPVKDQFTGEVEMKKIQVSAWNGISYYLNHRFGSLNKYTKGEEGTYFSNGY